MEFVVEKSVPLAPNGSGRPAKYPFSKMEVGDSFLVPLRKGDNLTALQGRVVRSLWRYKRGKNKKFTTRRMAEGLRVWRIK